VRSLQNLDKEVDKAHGDKDAAPPAYECCTDSIIDALGIPAETTMNENPSGIASLQSLHGSSSHVSSSSGPPGTSIARQGTLPAQRSQNIDHRNHSHTHGVCHDETGGRNNQPYGPTASASGTTGIGSGTCDFMSSVALGLRLRDLRRLDFSINPNEQLDVQVTL
jgi:hypothetical protein